jgi:multidrug transporter EmrE-like cation transporter
MSFSVQLGLVLSLATALTSILGFLYKHRGAVDSPDVELRHPIRSSLTLFGSGWYVLGIVIATGSWGLHVASLALAPISLVQTVIAGGLVLLTVVADRVFGFAVTRREWIGVGLTAAGLAVLAATLSNGAEDAYNSYGNLTLTLYVGGALVLGTAAAFGAGRIFAGGPLLAASAGLLWGASDTSIKALTGGLDDGILHVIWNPLALVILLASLVGLSVSARSLQIGEAVSVIAITSAAANVVTIAAGPIVFGEPFPSHPLAVAVRVLAFALVILAASLTPPPVTEAHGDLEADPEAEPQPA